MRIHSDIIKREDLYNALPNRHLYLRATEHGSRSRAYAFECGLEYLGPKNAKHKYWKNSGKCGAANVLAATYDEWGEWLLALFEIDPDAICGNYRGVRDFHDKTHGKYSEACPNCGGPWGYPSGHAVGCPQRMSA